MRFVYAWRGFNLVRFFTSCRRKLCGSKQQTVERFIHQRNITATSFTFNLFGIERWDHNSHYILLDHTGDISSPIINYYHSLTSKWWIAKWNRFHRTQEVICVHQLTLTDIREESSFDDSSHDFSRRLEISFFRVIRAARICRSSKLDDFHLGCFTFSTLFWMVWFSEV